MKDLYFNLNIDRDASTEDVAAALQQNPEMGAYASILLDEDKRSTYDRTHATLSTIGLLRHNLGLNAHDSWFLDNYPNFAPGRRPSAPRQEPREDKAKEPSIEPAYDNIEAMPPGPTSPDPYRWLVPALLAIIAVSCLLLIFTFF